MIFRQVSVPFKGGGFSSGFGLVVGVVGVVTSHFGLLGRFSPEEGQQLGLFSFSRAPPDRL